MFLKRHSLGFKGRHKSRLYRAGGARGASDAAVEDGSLDVVDVRNEKHDQLIPKHKGQREGHTILISTVDHTIKHTHTHINARTNTPTHILSIPTPDINLHHQDDMGMFRFPCKGKRSVYRLLSVRSTHTHTHTACGNSPSLPPPCHCNFYNLCTSLFPNTRNTFWSNAAAETPHTYTVCVWSPSSR